MTFLMTWQSKNVILFSVAFVVVTVYLPANRQITVIIIETIPITIIYYHTLT